MPKRAVAKSNQRVVKDSPLPSTLGKDYIREAVLAVSRKQARTDENKIGTATKKAGFSKKMSKTQLATELAEATGTNKKTASAFLESLCSIAYREAKMSGEFTVPSSGILVKRQTKARTGRNPPTGAEIKIPAKTVMRFRMSKTAKGSDVGRTARKK